MWSKLLTATGLALALALPAAAQSTQSQSSSGSSSSTGSGQQAGTNGVTIRQHITQDLQQAGYSQVQVMPESFLVRATDKQGHPVMMVVGPDSVTAVTELPAGGQSGSGSNGNKTSK